MNGDSSHDTKLSSLKRIPLSCNQCKRRKVRCDRKSPCFSCIKHKVGNECEYHEDRVMNHETAGTLMVFKRKQDADTSVSRPLPKRKRRSKKKVVSSNDSNPQANQKDSNQPPTNERQPPANGHQGQANLHQWQENGHQIPPNGQLPSNGQLPANGNYVSHPIPNPPIIPHPNQMPYTGPNGNFAPQAYGGNHRLNPAQVKAHHGHEKGAQGFNTDMYTGFGAPFLGPGNWHIYTPNGFPAGGQGMPRSPEESPENKSDLDEAFDLYTGYSSVSREGGKNVNHGPFSWFSYIQKDMALRAIWDVTSEKLREHAFQKAPGEKGQDEFESSGRDVVAENPALQRAQISPNTRRDLKATLNKKTLALGLTVFEGTMDQSLDIIEKLKLILPNKRALFLLIKRFFEVVYPYTCVLDETYFRAEVNAILGPECKSEEKFEHINIRKRKDFATMGTLLIVLRISYLSTFSNIGSENEDIVNSPYSLSDDIGLDSNGPPTGDSNGSEYLSQRQRTLLFESKYILTHPVSIDFMEYVQACLDQLPGAHKCSLSVLQCLIMKRIYSDVAPEQTDSADGYEASSLNAMCIHIGYFLGIHRDLKHQSDHKLSVEEIRCANICRKMWFFIKLMDLKLAWQFGFPIMVDYNYSNLQGPYFTSGASNVHNDDVEIKLCSLLTWTGSFYRNFGEMIRRCLMLQCPLKVSELLQLMDMFEDKVSEDLGTLSDYTSSGSNKNPYFPEQMPRRSRKSSSKSSFNTGSPGVKIEFNPAEMSKEKVVESPEFPFVKVLKLKVYMNMKQFSMSIFYHLFLNFEKTERFDLSFSYISKIVSFYCGEFIPEILDLLLSSRSNFDSASTTPGLILNHSIIALVQKCNQIFFCIIARARIKAFKMMERSDHKQLLMTSESYRHRFDSICSLTNIISEIVNYNCFCLSRLSHRYFYAWRISRTHTYVLKKTASDAFNKKITELDYHFMEMTQPQIDEILALCRQCYTKIEPVIKTEMTAMGENGINHNNHNTTTTTTQDQFNTAPTVGVVQGNPRNIPNAGHMMMPIQEHGQTSNEDVVGIKNESLQFPQNYQDVPQNNIEDYIPPMATENFAFEKIPEIDLLWQQISNMKEDNKREFTRDAPNDISDKFFPLSPQQDIFPPFDMNGAFEGFSNIYI